MGTPFLSAAESECKQNAQETLAPGRPVPRVRNKNGWNHPGLSPARVGPDSSGKFMKRRPSEAISGYMFSMIAEAYSLVFSLVAPSIIRSRS